MTHEQKIQWMAVWCAKNGLQLVLEGEVGFGRECVGISVDGNYPDYHWYDDNYDRIDPNGKVWTPENAYHKHPCVAVLGRGKKAESQLYDWLKWFDENNFKLETDTNKKVMEEKDPRVREIKILLGQHNIARMVRQPN